MDSQELLSLRFITSCTEYAQAVTAFKARAHPITRTGLELERKMLKAKQAMNFAESVMLGEDPDHKLEI